MVDVVIRKGYGFGARRWTGPWPLDFAGVTLTNSDDVLVVELEFSRLAPEDSDISGDHNVGDTFRVFLDGNGDRHPEREIYVPWGWRGGLLTSLDDQQLRCQFEPDLDEAAGVITLRMPRSCFPNLERMRALTWFNSFREDAHGYWTATDTVGWTRFAQPGETVSRTDPAQ